MRSPRQPPRPHRLRLSRRPSSGGRSRLSPQPHLHPVVCAFVTPSSVSPHPPVPPHPASPARPHFRTSSQNLSLSAPRPKSWPWPWPLPGWSPCKSESKVSPSASQAREPEAVLHQRRAPGARGACVPGSSGCPGGARHHCFLGPSVLLVFDSSLGLFPAPGILKPISRPHTLSPPFLPLFKAQAAFFGPAPPLVLTPARPPQLPPSALSHPSQLLGLPSRPLTPCFPPPSSAHLPTHASLSSALTSRLPPRTTKAPDPLTPLSPPAAPHQVILLVPL